MKRAAKTRERKGDWVVMGGAPGEVGYCTRCGEGLRLNLPQRIEVFAAAARAFTKIHSDCEPGQYHERPTTTPEQWAAGRDSGTSSLTIYSAITGNPSFHRTFDVPHDPADFGRCYRLLKLFPTWRKELDKTIALCPKWKPFVERWRELEELYEAELPTGTAPKTYALIKELRG